MNQPGSFTTLEEWLPWLETLSPREIVLGLERVRTVLDVLDLPRPKTIISVAGTNGKGSSVAMLEALFLNGGCRTGCYTSPHVSRYNERIRIDGKPAGDAQILHALQRVEDARGKVPLTFFEFGTLAALVAFAEAEADTLLLEVGMGGRLDAVNAVESDGCLITNIALDHTAWLGSDHESIAAEKAGIMRPGKPVVFGASDRPRTIDARAAEVGALLSRACEDFQLEIPAAKSAGWTWQGRHTRLTGLVPPGLAGQIQYRNAAAVLALLEALGFENLLTTAHVNLSLGKLFLAGRFQLVGSKPAWVLDVAHNPAAADVLGDALAGLPVRGKTTAVVGMFADKDVAGFVAALSDQVDTWIAVTVPGVRAAPASALAQNIANHSGKPCLSLPQIPDALELAASRAGAEDRILVAGSFYLVGPALDWLAMQKSSEDGANSLH